jgi:hypothetical protein
MNNVFRRQIKPLCYFGFSRFAAVQRPTFFKQLSSRRSMNRAVNAIAAEQRGIRGVHDSVNFDFCNVAVQYFDSVHL